MARLATCGWIETYLTIGAGIGAVAVFAAVSCYLHTDRKGLPPIGSRFFRGPGWCGSCRAQRNAIFRAARFAG